MSNKPVEKVSRRDAIKILTAAAGAVALANIPDKWIKPDADFGVLPAHAQTSGGAHTIAAGPDDFGANFCPAAMPFDSTATITPPTPGILLRYTITLTHMTLNSPASPTGTVATDGTGTATLSIDATKIPPTLPEIISILWEFDNPADGSGSDTQTFEDNNLLC
ncbi:MAG: twin-arginine translocation signal domain-containing protein [Anaerolineales bacterium]|nr:twin-arginine translocation signal domain-containing protein [Anaerolineales bacterium]